MSEADKILKDAVKITGELYLAYGYVQTPIETLDSTVKASSDFIATIYESSACLCLRDGKWWNLGQAVSLRYAKIPTLRKRLAAFGAGRTLSVSIGKH